MICQRRIIQFNNYVFRGLVSANYVTSNRITSNDYLYASGANAMVGGFESQELSLTLEDDFCGRTFDSKEDRKLYLRWERMQLSGKGWLYALDSDGSYIRTQAIMKSRAEEYGYNNAIRQINITFTLPSGNWEKCDEKATFIIHTCDKDYYRCNQCVTNCDDCETVKLSNCGNCNCGNCNDCDTCEAICYCSDIDWCKDGNRIETNCNRGYNLFQEKFYGEEIALNLNNYCSPAVFCTQTEVDSSSGIITLLGTWVNPVISINSRELSIAGVYKNKTTIDISTNQIVNVAENGVWEDVTENRCSYQLPYFKAKNGQNNYVKACGYQDSDSKLFIKFTEYLT